jgi:hypothetical protein
LVEKHVWLKKCKGLIILLVTIPVLLATILTVNASSNTQPIPTNITSTSFTVTWITTESQQAEVHYGASPNNLNLSAYDERGNSISSKTHQITIVNLTPDTTYYYEVVSGGSTYRNDIEPYSVKTGSTLQPQAPNNAYGQITSENGVPLSGALVTLKITDNDNKGSSGESRMLSTISDENGWWSIQLDNARVSNGTDNFSYDSGDKISLTIQADISTKSVTINIGNHSPASTIVINSANTGSTQTTTTENSNLAPSEGNNNQPSKQNSKPQSEEPNAILGVRIPGDIVANSWYYEPVTKLLSRKIISGYTDGTFKPNSMVTRQEFAKMICLAQGWKLVDAKNPSFSDVPKTSWAYRDVETAKANGVISGYAGGVFNPSKNISRAEIATILAKTLNLESGASSLSDIKQHWAQTSINACVKSGIVKGYPDNAFKPDNTATRAEAAKMINSTLK